MQVYLDNAATTRIDEQVLRRMNEIQNNTFANASSSHKLGRIAYFEIQKARKICADYINAKPEQIFFTSGGTESDNWALNSAVYDKSSSMPLIITDDVEHHAVLNCLKHMQHRGLCRLKTLPVDINGDINREIYKEYLKKQPVLVSIMTANNEIGNVYDIKGLCREAHEVGSLFHTDAVAAFGKTDIDVNNTNVDFMSVSAHKFYGPKGMGFLYVKNPEKISPFILGGSQEEGLRAGTYNTPAIVGMGEAVRQISSRDDEERIVEMKEMLLYRMKANIPNMYYNGSSNTLGNILNVTIPQIESDELMLRLAMKEIYASSGAACNSKEKSHVLKAMGKYNEYDKYKIPYATIRFSLGKDNNTEQIIYTVECVSESVNEMREKRSFVF